MVIHDLKIENPYLDAKEYFPLVPKSVWSESRSASAPEDKLEISFEIMRFAVLKDAFKYCL